jgi:hypothetical protein
MDVKIHVFLALTVEVEWLDSRLGRFIPRDELPLRTGYESLWPEHGRNFSLPLSTEVSWIHIPIIYIHFSLFPP